MQAQYYYLKALELFCKVGNPMGQASALNELGRTSQVRGKLEQAQSYHQNALVLFRDVGSIEGQAEALRELGTVAQQTGDWVVAVSYLQEALTLFQVIGAKLEIAKTEELLKQVQVQVAAA